MAASTIGPRFRDGCISLVSLGVVIAGVVLIDETCRGYLLDALHGQLPAAVGPQVQHVTRALAAVVPTGNPALLAFGASASVLVVLMFRP